MLPTQTACFMLRPAGLHGRQVEDQGQHDACTEVAVHLRGGQVSKKWARTAEANSASGYVFFWDVEWAYFLGEVALKIKNTIKKKTMKTKKTTNTIANELGRLGALMFDRLSRFCRRFWLLRTAGNSVATEGTLTKRDPTKRGSCGCCFGFGEGLYCVYMSIWLKIPIS